MRIDAHQHFWVYEPQQYAWIDTRMEVLRRDFSPGQLAELLPATGIDGTVAVQVRQSLIENDYLLDLSDRHGFIRGVVGWVDLCSTDVTQMLDRYRSHPRFVGVRHLVQDEPDDDFLLRDDFCRGIEQLADLSYDILIYPQQLPAAIAFVDRFPNHRFVLDHLAKPEIARNVREPWATQIRALAEREHVHCKVSGLVTEADWRTWRPADLSVYLDIAVEAFGTKRLMIGSDWPVCTLAASYDQVLSIGAEYFAAFSADEQRAIFGANAANFYRLPDQ